MDLHFLDAKATPAEREALDALLGPEAEAGGLRAESGGHEARARRRLLLPALHALHDRVGWISRGGLNELCRRLTIAPADAYGVASFYGLFSTTPRPSKILHVCTDVVCLAAGAAPPPPSGDEVHVAASPCLGLCERAPAALWFEAGAPARERALAPVEPDVLAALALGQAPPADGYEPATSAPQAGSAELVLLRRIGRVDPASLDSYRAHGGYAALRRAVELGPAGVIREVSDSKLAGRGGAAFPTGRKWDAVARQPTRPHYLVCNADESEPGTFKDRVIVEGDPFALVEACTIAAYACGVEQGYVYLRGEYPLAHERLGAAIEACRRRGLLGDDVMGAGFRFELDIVKGAGAYICGEETAIFNSIEGRRGEPRNKPPFPVESGLFAKPTVVNNVETLVNVLAVLERGGPAYAELGTAESTGPKLFCVSGAVARPGVYEVPFGPTLRELLELAGGVPEGRRLQAVLLGGAAGGFVGPDQLDVALTFEGARAAGVSLGSGVVFAVDDTVEVTALLLRIAEFFRDESCGQCVPCRVGTVRQAEVLRRLIAAPPGAAAAELALFADIARAMRDASICGLGQTAPGALESAIARLGVFGV
ncbi:MAG: NADH-ubiquinone oxidoreductase-F iron-sulfur binding region domain-containing protein [Acidimicrobiales bacterium]